MATTAELLLHAKLINEVSRPLKEIGRDLSAVKAEVAATGRPTAEQSAKMRQLATETRKAVRTQKELAASLGKAGTMMTRFVTLPVALALGYSTKAASDLNEAVTKTDAVFGTSAKAIHDMASTSAKDLGLSKRAAEDAAGSIGALVRPMGLSQSAAADMSTSLVRLSADLASFYNSSGEEALTAIRSGLVKESEPLRRFGVSLSAARVQAVAYASGLAKVGETLTSAQYAQATYAIILEDTKIAQGDFDRTAGGLANRMRIAKASFEDAAATLGSQLLPVVTELVSVAANLAQGFTHLPGPVRTFVLVAMGIGLVAGPILLVTSKVVLLRTQLATVRTEAVGATGALGTMASVAARALGATMAAYAGISYFTNKRSGAADAYVRGITGDVDASTAAGIDRARRKLERELEEQQQREGKGRLFSVGGANVFATGGDADRQERIDKLRGALSALEDQEHNLAKADAAAKAQLSATEPVDDMTTSVSDLEDALKDVDAAYDTFLGRFLDADEAAIAFQDAMAKLRDGMKDGYSPEDQSAVIDVTKKAYEQAIAEADAGLIAPEKVGQRSIDLLNELRGTVLPEAQTQLDSYLGRLQTMDQTLTTTVELKVEGEAAALATIQRVGLAFVGIFDHTAPTSAPVTGPGPVPAGARAGIRLPGGARMGDTASGSIRGTIAAHALVGAGIPGIQVTNAWVGGFPGSDHHAGRALDLVGSGLGQYAERLRSLGGFAEFHGAGPTRHLHAVYGDTATTRRGGRQSAQEAPLTVQVDARGSTLGETAIRSIARGAALAALKESERRR
jgi:hypothetical protein